MVKVGVARVFANGLQVGYEPADYNAANTGTIGLGTQERAHKGCTRQISSKMKKVGTATNHA